MKMLTIVLAATATTGTVAAGGVAMALTGSDQNVPAAPNVAAQAPKASLPPSTLPVDSTKCVQLPDELSYKVDREKLKNKAEVQKLTTALEAEWLKSKLPVDQPAALPTDAAAAKPQAAPGKVTRPEVEAAVAKAVERLKAGVPTCLPSDKPGVPAVPSAPGGAPNGVPTDIPSVPAVDCSTVAPVVQIGGTVEQSITAKTGLKFVSKKTRAITVKGHKVCVVTQRWTSKLGWMEVDRIKGRLSVDQVRQQLQLPHADAVTMGKDVYWKSPLPGAAGTGLMYTPVPGTVEFVKGSLTMQPQLQQIATTLNQAG